MFPSLKMATELQSPLRRSCCCILMAVSMVFLLLPSNCIMATAPLKFLVVGDWGRKGLFNQSQVAAQMGKIAQQFPIDFVISTGDNFYEDGLNGTDDPSFEQSFSAIYSASSLQTPWHLVLGNHDYRGDTLSQLDSALKRRDSRWNCYRTSTLRQNLPLSCKDPATCTYYSPLHVLRNPCHFVSWTEIQRFCGARCSFVDFFFIDTTPFVDVYWTYAKHQYDWRGILPRERYLKKQLKDLDNAFKVSKATWKIVVGHHPIRSIGTHDDTEELKQQLLPILEANKVDLYVNGHAHCLQDFESKTSSMHFLTSGGGSKAWGGVSSNANKDGLKFFYPGQGFMSMQMTPTFVNAVFYDIDGKSLYSLNLSKS